MKCTQHREKRREGLGLDIVPASRPLLQNGHIFQTSKMDLALGGKIRGEVRSERSWALELRAKFRKLSSTDITAKCMWERQKLLRRGTHVIRFSFALRRCEFLNEWPVRSTLILLFGLSCSRANVGSTVDHESIEPDWFSLGL